MDKKFDESLRILNKVLSKEPENILALFLKADILNAEQQYDEAAQVFNKIINTDVKQTTAYIELSKILARQNKLKEAERTLIMATVVNPTDIRPSLLLFSIYIRKKDFRRGRRN